MEWVKSGSELAFDPYAQDVNDYAFLQRKIPGIIIKSAGGICPFQVAGYLHDYHLYVRSEWGSTTMKLALDADEVVVFPLYSATIQQEITPDNWEEVFVELVENLSRAEGYYEFSLHPILLTPERNFARDDEGGALVVESDRELVGARGQTPEEAYASLFTLDEYFQEKLGFTEEQWRKLTEDRDPLFPPATPDKRVFPEEGDPAFKSWIRY